jgi:hypothetical protein
VTFQVLTVAGMWTTAFSGIALCILVETDRRFSGTFRSNILPPSTSPTRPILGLIWMLYVPPQCWYPATSLPDAASQETNIDDLNVSYIYNRPNTVLRYCQCYNLITSVTARLFVTSLYGTVSSPLDM